jgi:hypothetical protein
MYKSFSALEYKDYFGLPADYTVDGLMLHGTWDLNKELENLKLALAEVDAGYTITTIGKPESFIGQQGLELNVHGKRLWFFVVYGSSKTSEFTHLASLFGSKKNILLGSCGGLLKGAKMGDVIVPTESASDGTSTFTYDRTKADLQPSDTGLSESLAKSIGADFMVHRQKTATCQAMLGETYEDVQEWSAQGFAGVEMEAAAFFAVSNHFNVPSAAVLRIADNLIENETVHSESFISNKAARTAQKVELNKFILKELVTD